MLTSWRAKLVTGSAVVLALAGCNAVFGISKGELEEASTDGGAGSGGTAGSSGAAGTGGVSGNAGTSSGGTAGTGATAGAGGAAGTGGAAGQGGAIDDTQVAFIQPGDAEFKFSINNSSGMGTATARLSYNFEIDVYEVTNRRYKVWRDAKFPKPSDGQDLGMGMTWSSSWDGMVLSADDGCYGPSQDNQDRPLYANEILTGNELNPIVCMNWYSAVAFCAFESKRLPTETEWMYVATAAGTRSPYPFTGTPDCSKAIFDSNSLIFCGFPKPVGSAPAGVSVDGLFDLAGSVFEWVWDQEGDYPTNATMVDYVGPTPFDGTLKRVRKGGAFISHPDEGQLETWSREQYPPTDRYNDMGFRCARTVQ